MRYILTAVAVLMALNFGATAQEDVESRVVKEDSNARKMAHKWDRGVRNTLTGVCEIPAQTIKGYDRGFDPFDTGKATNLQGGAYGVFRGVGHAAGRTTYGIYEMFTFWAANPESNANVGWSLDGYLAWDTEQPAVDKDAKPIKWYQPPSSKALRGSKNLLFGITEFRYQYVQGDTESVQGVAQSTGRSLYYFISREINGAFELATFAMPSPADQVGVTYDIADPWNNMEKPKGEQTLDELLSN